MAAKKQVKVGVGGDPEVFVATIQEGKVVPVCGRIGGSKKDPIQFTTLRAPYSWLEDNVALEFNFDPAYSSVDFAVRVDTMMQDATKALKAKGLKMVVNAEQKFSIKELNLFQQAMEIGCDPDFCAHDYTGGEHLPRECPNADTLGNQRFAAGHIHVSYDASEVPAHAGALLFDASVVLPTLKRDLQGDRRKFYGKAGLYRPKPYGFEHRTMSNWWLRSQNREHLGHLAGQIMRVYTQVGKYPEETATWFSSIPHEDVKTIIEKEDIKGANALYKDVMGRIPPRMSFIPLLAY